MAPFPYMPMVALLASLISYQVVQLNVFAYAGYMVEYLGAVDDKDNAGYFTGMLMSAFMLGLTFSSPFWGLVSDRYGSLFVMMFGLVSAVFMSVGFGLSTSLAWAFIFRFLLGLLNGVVSASKNLVSEVCGKEHETVGMGVVTTSNSIGLVLGPGIGGLLAEPAKYHPLTFSEGGIFGRHPYLLPNLVGAGLSLLAMPLAFYYFKDAERTGRGDRGRDEDGLRYPPQRDVQQPVYGDEAVMDRPQPPCKNLEDVEPPNRTSSLNRAKAWFVSRWRQRGGSRPDDQGDGEANRSDSEAGRGYQSKGEVVLPVAPAKSVDKWRGYCEQTGTTRPIALARQNRSGEVAEELRDSTGDVVKPASLMAQPHIRTLLFMFALYSFSYSGFDEIFTLWALSSVGKGGLDWSTLQIGQAFLVCGLLILIFEIFAVPNLTPRLGVRTSQRVGSVFELPVYFLIPLLSRMSSSEVPVTVAAMALVFTANVCTNSFYVGISLAINNATVPHRRGELNGLSMSVSSFARALSPVFFSSLFAFSIDGDHPFPFDYHLVFYLLASIRLVVALMGWYRITGAESEDVRALILVGVDKERQKDAATP